MEGGSLLALILAYRYWVLFPIACFEGPITGFIVGSLAKLGYFNPWAAFCVMLLGDIIPDGLYYAIGRYGERGAVTKKYLGKVGIGEEELNAIRGLWFEHGGKTMFFSKLAYGLSTAFLISAGLVKLPFGRFFVYALPVTVAQYAVLMLLGYHFTGALGPVSNIFSHVQYLVLAVAVVGVGYYYFTRYMRRKLLAAEREEKEEIASR